MESFTFNILGEVRDEGVSPQYRPGGQCVLEHPQGGLEARPHHQLHSLWAPISFLGKFRV